MEVVILKVELLQQPLIKQEKYGIHSAMSVKEAYERYPKLIMVPNKHDEYGKYSRMFIDVLRSYTDQVYQASIDEHMLMLQR